MAVELAALGTNASVTLTIVLGAASAVLFFWALRARRTRAASAKQPSAKVPAKKFPQAKLPEDGKFTIESLATFDGISGPICMGVCGLVLNVSSSENIQPGQGYGALWAGKDATYALATVSLKPEHANVLDFSLGELTEDQQRTLASWYKHFTTKYEIVGRLQEYEGWDFSQIEEDAKSQTPFGAGNAGADTADAEAAADSAGASAAGAGTAEDSAHRAGVSAAGAGPTGVVDSKEQKTAGTLLKAGDRVMIRGLQSRPELNGTVGSLRRYVQEKGRFEVAVKGEEASLLLKPESIVKAE